MRIFSIFDNGKADFQQLFKGVCPSDNGMEEISRIIIAENSIKANLKRNICPKCGRLYFMHIN